MSAAWKFLPLSLWLRFSPVQVRPQLLRSTLINSLGSASLQLISEQ
jgi:hypothetical protein